MAKIVAHKELPLNSLVIGKGQVRLRDMNKGINELADSIRSQGLLQPILVCEGEQEGTWEILTGQRRFLAYRELGLDTIMASILDEQVDMATAKTISITENLLRRNLAGTDLVDAVTALYMHYGSEKAVHEKTGIPLAHIRDYVKAPRLKVVPELEKMVKDGKVDLRTALKALDAANIGGEINEEEALILANEMASMSGTQRDQVIKIRTQNPNKSVADAIEEAKGPGRLRPIQVSLTAEVHTALKKFAVAEDTTQGDAAVEFISQSLIDRGYLE